MPTRIQRVLALAPSDVRSMLARTDRAAMAALLHDLGCLTFKFRTQRLRASAPAGLIARMGRLMMEFVRTPVVLRIDGRDTSDIAQWQFCVWSDLEKLNIRAAASIAASWCLDRRLAPRLEGARFLCSLAPLRPSSEALGLLSSTNGRIAQQAMFGVTLSHQLGRMTPRERTRVIHRLQEIVSGKCARAGRNYLDARATAADAILEIGGEQGYRFLFSSAVLHSRNRSLREVLLALTNLMLWREPGHLRRLQKHVDSELLWALFDQWKAGSLVHTPGGQHDAHSANQIAGCVLLLCAAQTPERVRLEAPLAMKVRDKYGHLKDFAEKALKRARRPNP